MRINRQFTVGAGPLNVATGLATAASEQDKVLATRVFVQMEPAAGGGLGYVLDGIRWGRVPAILTVGDVTAVLAAAGAAAPGGSYDDQDFTPSGGIDISKMWVHGAAAGNTIRVSYDVKN